MVAGDVQYARVQEDGSDEPPHRSLVYVAGGLGSHAVECVAVGSAHLVVRGECTAVLGGADNELDDEDDQVH